jgi:beta-aspartyl-dipeptidase (metallo-type)
MFTLLKNANVYAPQSLGIKSVLLCGSQIIAIEDDISSLPFDVQTVDCKGKILSPGFIDQHIHLIGGGGEAGFNSRTPAVSLSKLLEAGLTTVVGVLGTDGISRSPKDLYAKSQALTLEGIQAYMHTGSYELPTRTITGNIRDDITFVPSILGVKIALADHRSSFPTLQELLRIVSDIRIGSMLAGKKGLLHIHLGGLPDGFDLINAVVAAGLPIHHLSPTHVARTEPLFKQAIDFALAGGHIDVTSGGSRFAPQEQAVKMALDSGVPFERITISSDGNGSVPRFNDQGKVDGLSSAPVDGNINLLPKLVDAGIPLEQVFSMLTANVADSLGINSGRIAIGQRADLCLFNDDMTLERVYAKGTLMLERNQFIARGNFE